MQDFNLPFQNHILTKYPLSVFFHTDIHVLSLYCIDIYIFTNPLPSTRPSIPFFSPSIHPSVHFDYFIILSKSQNFPARIITGTNQMEPAKVVSSKLGWTNLKEDRNKQRTLVMFNMINYMTPGYSNGIHSRNIGPPFISLEQSEQKLWNTSNSHPCIHVSNISSLMCLKNFDLSTRSFIEGIFF